MHAEEVLVPCCGMGCFMLATYWDFPACLGLWAACECFCCKVDSCHVAGTGSNPKLKEVTMRLSQPNLKKEKARFLLMDLRLIVSFWNFGPRSAPTTPCARVPGDI